MHRFPALPALILLTTLAATHTEAIEDDGDGIARTLATDGRAELPIVISPAASEIVREAAASLAGDLKRITGAEFQVVQEAVAEGIILAVAPDAAASPFDREAYSLRCSDQGLLITGNSDMAVRHGVWDLLHHIGYRQYFPGDAWEIIPKHRNLTVQIDTHQRPDFAARRIWYNWGLWGYNNEPYLQWTQRNRVTQGFELQSGHAYGAIIARNREAFDANPEFFAVNAGQRRSTGGDLKFCISNPELRQLVIDDAVRQIEADPARDSISMDPSDGSNWCECQACAAIGNISDRALKLANEVAAAVNRLDHGPKYVGMYAYNEHSPPPSIDVHPNVIISVATGFLRGGYTLDQIIDGWRERGATLGIYDYFSVIAWDWNLPARARSANARDLARRIAEFHKEGARFFDAESGDAWGPYGLGYYVASRVLWDTGQYEHVEAIIDEFLKNCFGPARGPMAEFYSLIMTDDPLRPHADLVGRMYRHLDAARRPAGDDRRINRRLDDLILYTRHVELYHAYADATGEAQQQARDAVLAHSYRIRPRMMVHSYGIWARLIGQAAAHQDDHPLHDDRPFSADEIAGILADGISNNEPVEIEFERVAYSENLLPAAGRLGLDEVDQPGSWPTVPQDRQHYLIWVEEAPAEIALGVRVQKVWDIRPHRITLHSPKQVHIEPVDQSDIVRPDGRLYDVRLKTTLAGQHRLEITDGGDYTRLTFPENIRVSVASAPNSPGVNEHFRGPWSLYFYVPKGTQTIGGWASRIANWAPRISGTLHDADGNVQLDFAELEEGFFNVPVAAGQAGRLWQFRNSQGKRLLMTVPPYLAPTARDLLLPAEVIQSDAP